jgi:hypothetical protein
MGEDKETKGLGRDELEGCLGFYSCKGFTLCGPDYHVLVLKHEGERVAVFGQSVVTKASIRQACQDHLRERHGGTVDGLGDEVNKGGEDD